jgi:hypothetical protein
MIKMIFKSLDSKSTWSLYTLTFFSLSSSYLPLSLITDVKYLDGSKYLTLN